MTVSEDFNEPVLSHGQQAAVDSDARALTIVASAGSGKTEVIARRVQRLIAMDQEGDGRIVALTYTVKAADELRGRLDSRLGVLARRVESDTIHGFSHNLLRTHGTRIGLPLEPELLVRDEDRVELFRSWLLDRGENPPNNLREVLTSFDLARARGQVADGLEDWLQALDDNGALDYPALLAKATELLAVGSVRRQVRRLYASIVVDEAQNLSKAQFDLIAALVADGSELAIPTMLVGDDKQSIVSFAGADPSLIAQFAANFGADRHELRTNFRSAKKLAEAANSVALTLGHTISEGVAFGAPGMIELVGYPTELEEGRGVADWIGRLLDRGIPAEALGAGENHSLRPEDIAVLSRSAAGPKSVADALADRQVSFSLASAPNDWLATSAGKVILELVGLRAAPDHRSVYWELERLLGRELGSTSLDAVRAAINASTDELVRATSGIVDVGAVSDLLPFLRQIDPEKLDNAEAANWQADLTQIANTWNQFDGLVPRSDLTWGSFRMHCARAQRGDDLSPGVRLLTVHKAQGREYAAVAIVGLNDGQFPDFRATSESSLRDELRTFYVGITRPRRVLMLTRPLTRETRYGPRSTKPSRFAALVAPSRSEVEG